MSIENEWRKRIAEQVRANCTPSSEEYEAGGDTLIRAVAVWIENPPEWSSFEAPRATVTDAEIMAASKALFADDVSDGWGPTAPAIAEECDRVARVVLTAAARVR